MQGRKTSLVVVLTDPEREQPLRWSRSTSLPAGLVTRSQAVWLVAQGMPLSHTAKAVGLTEVHVRQWGKRFLEQRLQGLYDRPGRGRKPSSPPLVDDYIVKMWLSAKVPRDQAFAERVKQIRWLYTAPLAEDEMVLCLDENTNLQPRPRLSPTLAASFDQPVRLEHEYKRAGALNLLAAFDTRTGQVYGYLVERKRQIELIAFLNQLEEQIPQNIRMIRVVLDNVPMHTGK